MSTPRPRLAGELVFALLMVLLTAFLLWTAFGISGLQSYASAGSFPMAAAALMLVCALINLAQCARAPRAPAAAGETLGQQFWRQVLPPVVLWTSLAIGAYMLALEWVGFIVGSYLFLLLGMFILGERRWGRMALISAVMLAAIYVVFQTAFSVLLPAGSLWQGVFQ